MSYEIVAKLHVKYDTNEVSDRFKKREFVLATEDASYPQYIKMQLTQERTSVIDPFEVGDQIKVHFDIRGNEYTNPKGEIIYFTNLNAWKVEKAGESQSNDGGIFEDSSFPAASEEPAGDDMEDDLPF